MQLVTATSRRIVGADAAGCLLHALASSSQLRGFLRKRGASIAVNAFDASRCLAQDIMFKVVLAGPS